MSARAAVVTPEPVAAAGGWRLGRVALQLLLTAGLAAAATSGWVRLGEGTGPGVAVALGAVGPAALALGASTLARRPWPGWAAAAGHLSLLALLAAVIAGGAGAAADAVTGGWARLLSTVLPAPTGSEVEVLAFVVAGAAGAVGAELALRGRGAAAPAVPAVLALLATRMATQGVPDSRLTGAAVAVALLAGTLAMARAPVIRPAVGLPAVVAAALVAAAAVPALPWAEARPPFDPRALRSVPPVEGGTVNPLARLRAWEADPAQILFRTRLSEAATLRLAVLDRYDGSRFYAAPRFTTAGSALPPPAPNDPAAGGPTRSVTADVVIAGLDGPWVPAPDRPTRVSGPAVAVDPETGVLVAPGGVKPGQRYRVTAVVPTDLPARVTGAAPAGAEQVGPAAAASPPGLPAELSDLASEVAGDASDTPLVRLGRLQELFRTGFREDPASPPGHSLSRLSAFLDPADRVGSTEQVAAAFAVLARSLGYPARVVVGFRLFGGGQFDVRGEHARAWPEVALAGAGWVPFDPRPRRGARAGTDRRPPEAEDVTPAEPVPDPPPPSTPAPSPPQQPAPAPAGRAWLPALIPGILVLAAAALGLVTVGGLKRRRRRARRTAPEPEARVRGAWAEAADRLVERGLGRPPSRTPRDAARAVAEVSGAATAPLADLGEVAERAAFAGPGAVGEPDADRAWADLDLVEAALAAEDGRLGSLWRTFDPRPLSSRSWRARGTTAPAQAQAASEDEPAPVA